MKFAPDGLTKASSAEGTSHAHEGVQDDCKIINIGRKLRLDRCAIAKKKRFAVVGLTAVSEGLMHKAN